VYGKPTVLILILPLGNSSLQQYLKNSLPMKLNFWSVCVCVFRPQWLIAFNLKLEKLEWQTCTCTAVQGTVGLE